MPSERAIGLFDSGLGGLTVVKAVRARLPHEDLVFLGDTARVPYGTRSAETVVKYALGCASHLLRHEVKMLVVACNTVSAVALDVLRNRLKIPVIGVIEPGAESGIAASPKRRVGVIATRGTVGSGAYERAIAAIDPGAKVFVNAAPLLVPLAEEGWTEGEVPRLAVKRYLEPLLRHGIDSLVLGCTHYPLLRHVIDEVLAEQASSSVTVVDSAAATAEDLARTLDRLSLSCDPAKRSGGTLRIMPTDMPGGFREAAARFLAQTLDDVTVEAVDIEPHTVEQDGTSRGGHQR